MSSIVTSTNPAEQARLREARPRFFSLVGGELFKVTRMWSTWITLVLLLGALCLPYLVSLTVGSVQDSLKAHALDFLTSRTVINLGVLRVFIGFFLIILAANVFGREYQLGTIRILLARGVGRVQLLFAKLVSVVVVALLVLLIGLLLNIVLTVALVGIKTGSLSALSALDSTFWHNMGLYLLTILASMGVTILMTMALTSLGRSFVFGLSASLAWFPADNILPVLLELAYALTKSDFWVNITQYLLGPNLNAMPNALIPGLGETFGTGPLAVVTQHGQTGLGAAQLTDAHVWLVVAGFSLVFLAVSVYLTWKRDVKE